MSFPIVAFCDIERLPAINLVEYFHLIIKPVIAELSTDLQDREALVWFWHSYCLLNNSNCNLGVSSVAVYVTRAIV